MLTRYEERNLVWVDLTNPNQAEVRSLMKEFNLDPLVAEELLIPSYKAKVERHGDSLYVILHFPAARGSSKKPEQEIDFVIGKHFLITTRYENIDPMHSFAKSFEVNSVLGKASSMHGGHLFASMLKNLYGTLINECDVVNRKLQDIEEGIFNGNERRMVAEISSASRVIHDFRQSLTPHQEMLGSLEPVGTRFFGPEFSYYIREVVGACHRVERSLQNLRDSLLELRATNDSLLNTKQNEIMKTLTIMAFVTFPLTLVSSIFGMNTHYLPIVGIHGDFWIIIGIMLTLALCFFVYFKRKGWL